MKITDVCTGCGNCYVTCPVHCIEMREGVFGEIIPYVDENRCLKCYKCIKSCPQNSPPSSSFPMACYAAWSADIYDQINSASGGVASAFLRYQFEHGYLGYACYFDDSLNLAHYQIDSSVSLNRARGSKYSQSEAYHVFPVIREHLKSKEQVLFVGTPCQVAALRSYLKRDYANLITVDIVCHGTPPNRYLVEHLKHLKLYNSVTNVTFRGKIDQCLTAWKDDRAVYSQFWNRDKYFKAFYLNIITRRSCLCCHYAQKQRVSDITLGDFWGLGELHTVTALSQRPSLILINTQKGNEFFERIKKTLVYESRNVMEGILGNGRLIQAPGHNLGERVFKLLYVVLGFEKSVAISLFLSDSVKRIVLFKNGGGRVYLYERFVVFSKDFLPIFGVFN